MLRVKVIQATTEIALENRINAALENLYDWGHKLRDIQYSGLSVIIVYEQKDADLST